MQSMAAIAGCVIGNAETWNGWRHVCAAAFPTWCDHMWTPSSNHLLNKHYFSLLAGAAAQFLWTILPHPCGFIYKLLHIAQIV